MRLLSSGIPSLLLITLAFFVTVFSNAQESTTAEPVTTTPEESETVDLDATNDDQTSGFFPAEEVEAKKAEAAETTEPDDVAEATETAASKTAAEEKVVAPLQSGPFVDLLGPQLLSLEMLDATSAQLQPHYTNDALRGKKVVGLYFSADWCGRKSVDYSGVRCCLFAKLIISMHGACSIAHDATVHANSLTNICFVSFLFCSFLH